MITTGIVREVNLSSNGYNSNTFMVELPIFNTAADVESYTTILPCTACLPGSVYDCYSVGDKVYVGFINNKFNYPVILGRIYQGLNVESSASITPAKLIVSDEVKLPENLKIGNLSYNDLQQAILDISSIENQENYSSEWSKLTPTTSGTTESNLYSGIATNIGKWVNLEPLYKQVYKWNGSIASNTAFTITFDAPTNISYCWWDNSRSCFKGIGQPYYKTSTNNLCLEINNNQLVIEGKTNKEITEFVATLLFTSTDN